MKYVRTRKFRAILTESQTRRYEENIIKARLLHNFAVSHLEKVYGYRHLERKLPDTETGKRRLAYEIVKLFNEAYPDLRKSLHSQAAATQVEELLTNFAEYRKTLEKAARMSNKAKQDYKENKRGGNPSHKSWYRKGSIRHYRDSAPKTVSLPANGQLEILSPHHAKIQDYGDIGTVERLDALAGKKLIVSKIKRHKNGKFELQLVYEGASEGVAPERAAGFDWNMAGFEILASSDGVKYKVPEGVIQRVAAIDAEIARLDAMIDINSKGGRRQKTLLARRERLFRKKRGAAAALNSKLAFLAPYRLFEIVTWRMEANGKAVGTVDPAYTSQVEHGTGIACWRPLSVRSWVGKDGSIVDRDFNAAKNIPEWYFFPERHARHWAGKQLKKSMGRGEPNRPLSGDDAIMSVSVNDLFTEVIGQRYDGSYESRFLMADNETLPLYGGTLL